MQKTLRICANLTTHLAEVGWARAHPCPPVATPVPVTAVAVGSGDAYPLQVQPIDGGGELGRRVWYAAANEKEDKLREEKKYIGRPGYASAVYPI